MKPFNYLLLAVFCTIAHQSFALAEGDHAQTMVLETQYTMSQQRCQDYQQADAAMNTLYQKLKKRYAKDNTFLRRFKKSQRYWLKFRDAQLRTIHPKAKKNTPTSNLGMCRCIALAAMTKTRNKQLRQMLMPEEGDVCALPLPAPIRFNRP
ncbi:MAG: lysozyme inhibitor LprI family protein [Mariprofundaceae bacterium]|nr:lysozyme inhibitor LprI family protein [Mariprofundaceae bacterium]